MIPGMGETPTLRVVHDGIIMIYTDQRLRPRLAKKIGANIQYFRRLGFAVLNWTEKEVLHL